MSETEPKPEAQAPRRSRWPALIRLGLGMSFLLALPIGGWFLLPRLELAHLAADRAAAALGREVTITSLRVTPGWNMRVELRGLSIANTEGGTRPEMVRLEALTVEFDLTELVTANPRLRLAEVVGLSILLEHVAERGPNWHFGMARTGPAVPLDRSRFPLFERITITGSEIIFRTSGGLVLPTRLDTVSLASEDPQAPMMLRAEGSYNALPITLEGSLGSVLALRDMASPFSLDLSGTAGETGLEFIGSAADPLNFDGVQGRLVLRAPNPAGLLALGGAGAQGVPNLPLELAGTLDRQGDVWRLTALDGALADAPLTGSLLQLTEGARGQPDALVMDLAFSKLDMNALLFAGGHGQEGDADLPLALVIAPDPLIEARLAAGELHYGRLHARDARLHVILLPGQLRVESLAMQAFGARISGSGMLEPVEDEVQVRLDLALQEGELDPLRRALGIRELPLSGRIEGRLSVTGRGKTLNAASRQAHVSAVLAMSGGTIAREVVEMATTDVRSLFRTARGRVRLSCAIGVLDMRAGVGEIAPLRVRSANGTIQGLASFDLHRQQLDLVIGSQRSTTAATALDIPVRVSGRFSEPEILPAQWSGSGRARLAAGDQVAPLTPALRNFAQRSPCYSAGAR